MHGVTRIFWAKWPLKCKENLRLSPKDPTSKNNCTCSFASSSFVVECQNIVLNCIVTNWKNEENSLQEIAGSWLVIFAEVNRKFQRNRKHPILTVDFRCKQVAHERIWYHLILFRLLSRTFAYCKICAQRGCALVCVQKLDVTSAKYLRLKTI